MTMRPDQVTRAEGLRRMAAFAPGMGGAYASGRNLDPGPGEDAWVSGLSPWVRRRLVTEEELVRAALEACGAKAAQKFISEVFWRGYFKGWLEHRPQVWAMYRAGLAADQAKMAADQALADRISAALAGETGIVCFDAWVRELRETGHLHNHARMWFASIWVFTLRLPWRMGADFFLSELLDGDAASNTLSWRWVAGLHTLGKTYAARSENIAKYTAGRFPQTPGLAQVATALDEGALPARQPLRVPVAPAARGRNLVLVTAEDCAPDHIYLSRDALILGICGVGARSCLPVAPRILAADRVAVEDAVARLGGGEVLDAPSVDAVVAHAKACGAQEVVTAFLPQGWTRDWADQLSTALSAQGITLAEDKLVWPHATAGFFKLKKAIPDLLVRMQEDPGTLPLFADRPTRA